MNKTTRGKKHICVKCNCIFYDLNQEHITCPKCKSHQSIKRVETIIKTNNKEKIELKKSLEEIDSFVEEN